jgi:uncharacterized membrane protein
VALDTAPIAVLYVPAAHAGHVALDTAPLAVL